MANSTLIEPLSHPSQLAMAFKSGRGAEFYQLDRLEKILIKYE